MAIKSREYISLLQNAYQVLPKLQVSGNEDIFFENLNEIRLQYFTIVKEYNNWDIYPGHDTAKLHEAIEIIKEYCKSTDVEVKFHIQGIEEIKLTKQNWSKYRNIDNFAYFFYENVNITSLIDF